MPSKIWSIMACNTPIIASFDIDSDLAEVIRDSGAGKCVEPGNILELSNAIVEVSKIKKFEHSELREYVSKYASKQTCVKKYNNIIKSYI